MFRLIAQVPIFNSHAPLDGPPDAFGGNGVGTLLHRTPNLMKAVYSFAVNGGALGNIALNDDLGNAAVLPPNAIITQCVSNWTTAMTGSNNASVSVATAAAADLISSASKASFTGIYPSSTTTPTPQTPSTYIALGTTATGYQIYLNALTSAITAGIGNIYVWYML